ncbi:MAG: ribonuclease H, partial [Bacteroidota bacterium]
NPGFGGYGAIILDSEKEIILKGGEQQTTNNRMELRAIIESLRWIASHCTGAQVHLFSDSNLFIQSITKGWKRKKNVDLWEEFDEALHATKQKKNEIKWTWVKAHANNLYNIKVDKVAFAEAQKQKNLPR